jgi:hypothetical protein
VTFQIDLKPELICPTLSWKMTASSRRANGVQSAYCRGLVTFRHTRMVEFPAPALVVTPPAAGSRRPVPTGRAEARRAHGTHPHHLAQAVSLSVGATVAAEMARSRPTFLAR